MIEDASDASFATRHVYFIVFADMFEHTIIYLLRTCLGFSRSLNNSSLYSAFDCSVVAVGRRV